MTIGCYNFAIMIYKQLLAIINAQLVRTMPGVSGDAENSANKGGC